MWKLIKLGKFLPILDILTDYSTNIPRNYCVEIFNKNTWLVSVRTLLYMKMFYDNQLQTRRKINRLIINHRVKHIESKHRINLITISKIKNQPNLDLCKPSNVIPAILLYVANIKYTFNCQHGDSKISSVLDTHDVLFRRFTIVIE